MVSVPFMYIGNFPPYVNYIYTQQGKYLQIGNFPLYVNYILAECPGSFATYETETNIKYTL